MFSTILQRRSNKQSVDLLEKVHRIKNWSALLSFRFSYHPPADTISAAVLQEIIKLPELFNFIRKFLRVFDELLPGENRVERLSLIFPSPEANNELPPTRPHQTFTTISFRFTAGSRRLAEFSKLRYMLRSNTRSGITRILCVIRRAPSITHCQFFYGPHRRFIAAWLCQFLGVRDLFFIPAHQVLCGISTPVNGSCKSLRCG